MFCCWADEILSYLSRDKIRPRIGAPGGKQAEVRHQYLNKASIFTSTAQAIHLLREPCSYLDYTQSIKIYLIVHASSLLDNQYEASQDFCWLQPPSPHRSNL